MSEPTDVKWDELHRVATEAAGRAYAPYSKFTVGAAGLVDDGRVVSGCNVENASHGLGLCAECGLVSNLMSSGGGRLVAVSIVTGDKAPCAPCGRCRQLLLEHGGVDLAVDFGDGPITMDELLPHGFTPERLGTDTGS